jgi:tRNA(Arg) A34 adenosine deaminase TadA
MVRHVIQNLQWLLDHKNLFDGETGVEDAIRHVTMMHHSGLSLPDWVAERIVQQKGPLVSSVDQMRFVLELAEQNILRGTGGPFAAAVFEKSGGRLLGTGVNLVVTAQASFAHAEMVALLFAQHSVGSHSLKGLQAILVSSAEPCAMCCGGLLWGGVSELITSARISDTESIVGFDEGPVHPQWKDELTKRGILIQSDVLRDEGRKILTMFKQHNGQTY